MKKCSELGRSMIEIIGVLAIISTVTMGIMNFVNSMHDKYKISRITQQITDLRKNISNRYVANGDYSVIKAQDMIDSNVIPPDMIDGKKIIHAYNAEVQFNGNKDTYEVTFPELPTHVCLELALMNWEFSGSSDLYRLKINNTEFNWPIIANGGKELPVTLVDAQAACSAGEYKNSITWTFR